MGFVVAEYVCEVHGKFDALVERPAPDAISCPFVVRLVKHMDPREECQPVPCGIVSPWTISAPLGRVKMGEVSQGKVTKAEVPTWTDTEDLGNGMPVREWKKKRDKVWREHRYQRNVRDGRKGMA